MIKLLYNILRLLRPRQWIKNFALFAAITFAGELFNAPILYRVVLAFIAFSGLASATYIINDIFDVKKDKLHPFKKFRPLANGDIPISFGFSFALFLIAGSLLLAKSIDPTFFAICLLYLAIQFLYSSFIKSIAVLDILAIASGYILRVYGGEFASGYHISVWLLLTTISISLFLAIGKRRSELTLLSATKDANIAATRKALSHYSDRLLDVYASIFATSTFISYSLFTFLENPGGFRLNLNILLPDTFSSFVERKWLMITIIPVVYGLMRYLQDIYEKHEGESPERVLLSDKALLIDVIIWVLLVIFFIYFVGPTPAF
jgi:4-hydroxybenzoate polyprenyltransferase